MSGTTTGLTAQRFEGQPLTQPPYSFRNVPKCSRDLTDSSITYADRREPFVDSMAEMILLTKECMRRQAEMQEAKEKEAAAAAASKTGRKRGSSKKARRNSSNGADMEGDTDEGEKKRTSKPLSLEYMADRTDVDDPIFGYFVRTKTLPEDCKDGDDDAKKPAAAAKSSAPSSSSSSSVVSDSSSASSEDGGGDKMDSLQSLPAPTASSTSTAITPYRHRIDPAKFQPSMLQGFITVTTFTNWQTTFRWDSMHDSAFSYDEPHMAMMMANGERKYDEDGTLAEAMQATVRSGDPWNEGIVWPRIAEISLLGGLGCGKTLVSLTIEKLENMAATGSHNYDFVCLQATENSVPFYEAMGFVRVGAILENDKFEEERRGQQQNKQHGSPNSIPSLDSELSSSVTGSGLGLMETTPGVFSSPVNEYVVKKQWERVEEIAKAFSVDIWDIIFLNKELYDDIAPRSWLKKGTKVFVPSEKGRANAVSDALRAQELEGEHKSDAPLWNTAKENDTPKMIASMFGVKTSELIAANRDRLPGLIGTSRLKESTRVKVSRFDLHDDHHVPYCHWTFPDDSFKDSEPSYMMARRLNRGGRKSKVKKALAVPIEEYVHVEDKKKDDDVEMKDSEASVPVKPKKPMSAYMIYAAEQRKALKRENPGMSIRELKKLMSAKWKDLPGIDKSNFEDKAKAAKKAYDAEMKQYEKDLKVFRKANPDWDPNKTKKDDALVNGVVKLTGHEEGDGGFEYYYCLTFIPDLQWCHLAPLRKVGTWGPGKGWRHKWMLVDESEGKEVDVSSTFCEPVKANPSKNSIDADEEVWDIPDSAPMPVEQRPIPNLPQTIAPSYPYRPLALFANGRHVPPFAYQPEHHHGQKRKRQADGSSGGHLPVGAPISLFFSPPHHGRADQAFESQDPGSGSHKRRKMTPGFGPASDETERVLPDGSIMPKIAPTRGLNGLFAKPRGRARLNCTWDARRGVWVPQQPRQVTPEQSSSTYKGSAPLWGEPAPVAETVQYEDIPEPGTVCKDGMYYSTFDDETCGDVAEKLGCSSRDLAMANADRYGSIKKDSRFEENTLLRIPPRCATCGKLGSGGGKCPHVSCAACDITFHLKCTPEQLSQVPTGDWYCQACAAIKAQYPSSSAHSTGTGITGHVCRSPQDVDHHPSTLPLVVRVSMSLKSSSSKRPKTAEEFTPGYVCKDGAIYCTIDDETCLEVANKLGCNWRNVAIANKSRYGVIKPQDRFEERTLLLIPKNIDPVKLLALSKDPVALQQTQQQQQAQQNIQIFEPAIALPAIQPGQACIDGTYYSTYDDETADMVASKLGCHWKDLAECNKERYGCIRAQARFEEGTTLIIPPTHDASRVKLPQGRRGGSSGPQALHTQSKPSAPEPLDSYSAPNPASTTVAATNTESDVSGSQPQPQPQPEAGAEIEEEEEEPETYYPGYVCKDMLFYTTLDNETPRMCANKLGCEWRDLVNINKQTYKGLIVSSKLEEGTILRIPEKCDHEKLRALYKLDDGDEKLDFCCECFVLENPDGPSMLLCDGCDAACHLPCTHDKLEEVPEGEWFCRKCAVKKSS